MSKEYSGGPYHAEYDSFRSSVPKRKIVVEEQWMMRKREWVVFDAGPKAVRTPLMFLPPVCGGADVFFKQLLALSSKGYRVISVEYPPFWSVDAFCKGFLKFLNELGFEKVHLFGASLGGYLAQKFAEHTLSRGIVASLILCNSFVNTQIFERNEAAYFYWLLPAVSMKRLVLGGFPQGPSDVDITYSVDFMVESLDRLGQEQLASRLTLNCARSACTTARLSQQLPVTIIDVYDDCALSTEARDLVHKAYPTASKASLKTGGNFPYLSRCGEVNVHIQIHLQRFNGTPEAASSAAPPHPEDQSASALPADAAVPATCDDRIANTDQAGL